MLNYTFWAHSKIVLHGHGMAGVGVRSPVGPQAGCSIVAVRKHGVFVVRVRFSASRQYSGHVAELVYAYASEAYVARLGGSNPLMPTL